MNVRDRLSDLYDDNDDAKRMIDDAGLSSKRIKGWSDSPLILWHNIIKEADKHNKVDNLIDTALSEYREDPFLLQIKSSTAQPARGPSFDDALSWQGNTLDDVKEKIINTSQLLPINFLERGLQCAECVVRIVNPAEVGTGFIIKDNLLVTNNHVLPNAAIAEASVIEFNFQQSISGADKIIETVELSPDDYFVTDPDSDITIVKVATDVNQKYGAITVDKITVEVGDRVSIIQHPGGGAKQIAIHENFVAFRDNEIIQYLTDTMPGSSGSPVFDQQWQLVAIHHSGGWLREPGSKTRSFRNEGSMVSELVQLLS